MEAIQAQVNNPSFFLAIALVFGVIGISCITTILASRILKTNRKRRHDSLREEFQKTINGLIILEHSKGNLNRFSLAFYLKDLRSKIRSSVSKQLLIDLLIANKRNLKGDSAAVLKRVYVRLRLKRYSCSKLTRHSSIKKIQGLQEIAEMECYDMLPAVQELFTHKKVSIRQESFIAMVRLASSSPFVLVDDYVGPITPWMQLTIHKQLASISPDKLPKFWRWFYSANKEIQKFAITMAHQFMQLDSIPHLSLLLNAVNVEIAGMAAEVLADMGAVEHSEAILNLGNRHTMNESLSLRVIRSFERIGNAEVHGTFLAWHMIHGSYAVRIEAMRVMQKLNLDCRNFLVDFDGTSDNDFQNIYAHINNPLLRK